MRTAETHGVHDADKCPECYLPVDWCVERGYHGEVQCRFTLDDHRSRVEYEQKERRVHDIFWNMFVKDKKAAIKKFGVLRYLWTTTDFLVDLPEWLHPICEEEIKQQVIEFDDSKCPYCDCIVDFCECPEAYLEFMESM